MPSLSTVSGDMAPLLAMPRTPSVPKYLRDMILLRSLRTPASRHGMIYTKHYLKSLDPVRLRIGDREGNLKRLACCLDIVDTQDLCPLERRLNGACHRSDDPIARLFFTGEGPNRRL